MGILGKFSLLRVIRLGCLLLSSHFSAGCIIVGVEHYISTSTLEDIGRYHWVNEELARDVSVKAQRSQDLSSILFPFGVREYRELPELSQYISELGHRIAAKSGRDFEWSFQIADISIANAFITDEGRVFITRGLLAYIQNEAQLAAILAHEIAHRELGHQHFRAPPINDADFGPSHFSEFRKIRSARGMAQSRAQELEADFRSVELMASLGYNTQEVVSVMALLQRIGKTTERDSAREAERSRYPDWKRSHPHFKVRLSKLGEVVTPGVGVINRDEYIRLLDGLTFGDSFIDGHYNGSIYRNRRIGMQIVVGNQWKLTQINESLLLRTKDDECVVIVAPAERNSDDYIRTRLSELTGTPVGKVRYRKTDGAWISVSGLGYHGGTRQGALATIRFTDRTAMLLFSASDTATWNKHCGWKVTDLLSRIKAVPEFAQQLPPVKKIRVIALPVGMSFESFEEIKQPQVSRGTLRNLNRIKNGRLEPGLVLTVERKPARTHIADSMGTARP